VLAILKGIMNNQDINSTITDKSAPEEWQGKTVQEALNVEYYTFKHRPMDTEFVVKDLMEQKPGNALEALNRSFCILSLTSTERVYSKENDIVTVSANLEYWLNADKVKLLEDLIEDMSIETTGIRIPVRIGEEDREVLIAFGRLTISEIQETTEFGEMAVCDFNVDLIFYPPVTSKSDFGLEFKVGEKWVSLPFSSLVFNSVMNQQTVPSYKNAKDVGSINLSRVKSISITFDGYKNNSFVDLITDMAIQGDDEEGYTYEINKQLLLKLTRGETSHSYNCIVKSHLITVQEDTGNEVHNLTLTTRGIR